MSTTSLNPKQKSISEVTQDLHNLFKADNAIEVIALWFKTFGVHICQDMSPTRSFDQNEDSVYALVLADMKTIATTVYDSIPLVAGSPDDIAAICTLDFFAASAGTYPKMRALVLDQIVNKRT